MDFRDAMTVVQATWSWLFMSAKQLAAVVVSKLSAMATGRSGPTLLLTYTKNLA